jgi:hypothetical protein
MHSCAVMRRQHIHASVRLFVGVSSQEKKPSCPILSRFYTTLSVRLVPMEEKTGRSTEEPPRN